MKEIKGLFVCFFVSDSLSFFWSYYAPNFFNITLSLMICATLFLIFFFYHFSLFDTHSCFSFLLISLDFMIFIQSLP